MKLSDFCSNDIFTVDGEAGIISHIFDQIGPGSSTAVDIGAGDGDSCSNTASLWRYKGWRALMVEPDPYRFQDLQSNTLDFNVVCHQGFARPEGAESIDSLLALYNFSHVDFMSIDVDGDDYFLLQGMASRPRVICIEFNPTIPPHIEMRQMKVGEAFGASVLAICRLAASLGYVFIGANRCNAFFVIGQEAAPFASYETDLNILFPREEDTYAVTDYNGRVVLCGHPLPWEAKEPYVPYVYASTNVFPVSKSPQHIRRGFESLWGPAVWLTPSGLSPTKLNHLLNSAKPDLVCIDITSAVDGTWEWMQDAAENSKYTPLVAGRVLGLVKKGKNV